MTAPIVWQMEVSCCQLILMACSNCISESVSILLQAVTGMMNELFELDTFQDSFDRLQTFQI